MIWESSYWKDDLLALSEKINNKYRKVIFSDETAVEFEKDIMLALYSVRKLEEASKLSSSTKGIQLEVKSYKNLKNVTKLNWHKIDELFDLDNPKIEKLSADKLYNQIIHSYIFLISTDETGVIDGYFFCSDRMRNRKLYYIELMELERFISIVGNDYPTKEIFDFDESIQDYRIYSETKK
ncbi:hypothetical protein SAMN05661091_1615 [Paenibacillus uliginis N3/975]|uniref:Uncharacterized protein n=1 Tax=Paenibacillus uliginis N3/975 TaxID=1313296 RepID=A0A1X7H402_9BACL|nr:hypothetical protein [Paenibacillus uliginis]SMF78825.1 hypothetical protein SAMN05661091_1615 [Paenibacillus uliginis N3/975]